MYPTPGFLCGAKGLSQVAVVLFVDTQDPEVEHAIVGSKAVRIYPLKLFGGVVTPFNEPEHVSDVHSRSQIASVESSIQCLEGFEIAHELKQTDAEPSVVLGRRLSNGAVGFNASFELL